MTIDEKGKALHDKASKGEKLSHEEQRFLEEWYAKMDQEEAISLNMAKEAGFPENLKAQIEIALAQLVKLSSRIQQIALENDKLRNENEGLRRQLGKRIDQLPA
jgi:hypothetical protein